MGWTQRCYELEVMARPLIGDVFARDLADWCATADVEDSDAEAAALDTLLRLTSGEAKGGHTDRYNALYGYIEERAARTWQGIRARGR